MSKKLKTNSSKLKTNIIYIEKFEKIKNIQLRISIRYASPFHLLWSLTAYPVNCGSSFCQVDKADVKVGSVNGLCLGKF